VDNDASLQGLSFPMESCPSPPQLNHPICDPFDINGGHYFGQFLPIVSGTLRVRIFIDEKAGNELYISNFQPVISPNVPKAEFSDVSGKIY
jgi:hypothetical protein